MISLQYISLAFFTTSKYTTLGLHYHSLGVLFVRILLEQANDIVEKIYFAAKYENEDLLQECQNEINQTTSNEKEIDYFRIKVRKIYVI